MSTLSYRTWDIWLNSGYFSSGEKFDGYFECTILGTLMVPQTLEFIAEKYEIRRGHFQQITIPPAEIVRQTITTEEGQLCLRLYEQLDTNESPNACVERVVSFLESLSLCVDCPLACPKIRFISHQFGKLLVANRRSIGRGMTFEVEERGMASTKLVEDFKFYSDSSDSNLVVGRRHYLTGMQLLALEDQITGLVDAAFMQFYQGCEALCHDPEGSLDGSKNILQN